MRPSAWLFCRVGLVSLVIAGGVATSLACGEPSYSFIAQPALENGCLGRRVAVDVLAGDDPGSCAPRCIVGPLVDGGRAAYVAETCGPLPRFFEEAPTQPFCPIALAARANGCVPDGGVRDGSAD